MTKHLLFALLALFSTFSVRGGCGAIAFLGDNNLWIGGDDCSGHQAWSYYLVHNLKPVSCRSFARSGATWTNNTTTTANPSLYSEVINDDNVIYNQALRLELAVDSGTFPAPEYIFIHAGTNDACFKALRPGIFSKSPQEAFRQSLEELQIPANATSLTASVRLVVTKLQRRFPSARIIIVGPTYSVKAPRTEIEHIATVLQESALQAGVGCVRIEQTSAIDPDKEAETPYLTTDGTHTTTQGAWQIAYCVYNYLAFNNWL